MNPIDSKFNQHSLVQFTNVDVNEEGLNTCSQIRDFVFEESVKYFLKSESVSVKDISLFEG